MLRNIETALLGYPLLPLLDFLIVKLFDASAIKTDEMVVVRAFVEFEDRLARFKMVSMKQTGLLELCKDAINRCQTDIHIFGQQDLVDILGTQVTHLAVLENVENFEPWKGRL